MPGVFLWGWDATNEEWIKLAVDANGYVKVDMSNINLGDLADVDVSGVADDDFFYYDQASCLWKPRKLVDADIPATIARDAEVAAAVAAEAADRVADVDSEEAARIAADAAHTALATGVHGVGAETINDLYDIIMNRRFLAVWYANIVEYTILSAAITLRGYRADLSTGATAYSVAICYSSYSGFPIVASTEPMYEVDFVMTPLTDVQVHFGLSYSSVPTDATGNFGIYILNNAFNAFSSDGTTWSSLDLDTPVAVAYYTIKQRLVGGAVKTWINGVAKADKTTNVPTTQDISTWVVRITNTAAANKLLYILTPKIVWKP